MPASKNTIAFIGNNNKCRLLMGKLERKSHEEDQDVDGWIILRWIWEKQPWMM
jgi:hypothetical protein